MRADFNPAYGDAVIPFVFLARLNALAVVPFILFYSVLSIGGDFAAQNSGLPVDFLLVIVGLTLLFMVFIEYLGRNREMGTQLRAGRPARQPALQEAQVIALPVASIFTQTFLTSLVAGGLLAGVPLMFTALGEQISEASGVLNIGLEGMMLTGAYTGFVGAYYGGHDWLGYLAAIGGGMLVSLIMVVFCVRFLLDQIVVGIAITLAAEGATSVLQGAEFGQSYPRLPAAPDRVASRCSTTSRSWATASSSSRSWSTSASR